MLPEGCVETMFPKEIELRLKSVLCAVAEILKVTSSLP
jgi:hypothetical protein